MDNLVPKGNLVFLIDTLPNDAAIYKRLIVIPSLLTPLMGSVRPSLTLRVGCQ